MNYATTVSAWTGLGYRNCRYCYKNESKTSSKSFYLVRYDDSRNSTSSVNAKSSWSRHITSSVVNASNNPSSNGSTSAQSLVEKPQYNIHSPNEVEASGVEFRQTLFSLLPNWKKEDIASRLPSSPGMGTYHILFML